MMATFSLPGLLRIYSKRIIFANWKSALEPVLMSLLYISVLLSNIFFFLKEQNSATWAVYICFLWYTLPS